MKRTTFSLIIFLLGIVLSIVAWNVPSLKALIVDLENSGYIGVLVVGVMYGSAFASPAATAIFAQLPDALDPLAVALIGGLGAVAYDFASFLIFRKTAHHGAVAAWVSRLRKPHWPKWAVALLGGAIISSPFPDELAAGILDYANLTGRQFMLVSFVFNTLGILLITSIF